MSVTSKTSAGDIPDIPDTSVLSVRATKRAQQAKRKRIVFLAVAFLFLALVGFGIYKIIAINTLYPPIRIYEFSMGQEIMNGDVGLTATALTIYEGQEIYTVMPDYQEDLFINATGDLAPIERVRLLVCELTFTNYGDQSLSVAFSIRKMQIGYLWSEGMSPFDFAPLNSGRGLRFEIAPGEKLTLRFPFRMYRDWGSMLLDADSWENIIHEPVDIILSEFPKIIIHLS